MLGKKFVCASQPFEIDADRQAELLFLLSIQLLPLRQVLHVLVLLHFSPTVTARLVPVHGSSV